jgi:hypothetical protein
MKRRWCERSGDDASLCSTETFSRKACMVVFPRVHDSMAIQFGCIKEMSSALFTFELVRLGMRNVMLSQEPDGAIGFAASFFFAHKFVCPTMIRQSHVRLQISWQLEPLSTPLLREDMPFDILRFCVHEVDMLFKFPGSVHA